MHSFRPHGFKKIYQGNLVIRINPKATTKPHQDPQAWYNHYRLKFTFLDDKNTTQCGLLLLKSIHPPGGTSAQRGCKITDQPIWQQLCHIMFKVTELTFLPNMMFDVNID